MSDRIFVRDPEHPERNGYVSQTAYDALWSKKGYVIEAPDPGPGSTESLTDEDLNAELDEKARLRGILDERGIEFDGRLGIKRLRQLVEQSA